VRKSEPIAGFLLARQPRWFSDWLAAYHAWQERLAQRGRRNLLWQLSRKRVLQVAVGALLVTGLIIFSDKLFALTERWLAKSVFSQTTLQLLFWTVLVLLSLAPLVAIWRNLSAMALLIAEVSVRGHPHAKRLRPLIETAIKIGTGAAMFVWLAAILPAEGTAKWLLVFTGFISVVSLFVLRRKLIYWHSEMEVELLSVIETGDTRMTASTAPWLQPHGEWNLHMVDCTLPDLSDCAGKQIAELDLRAKLGCSVVGIERQGFMIPLPPPESVLYPRDKVLLMGTTGQVKAGRAFLSGVSVGPVADSVFEEVRMEAQVVPSWSRATGKTLGELSPAQNHNVQIAGVRRGGLRILNPNATEMLRSGDEILVLGAPVDIEAFKEWLRAKPEDLVAGAD
jgi:CPA2 family monovalent cation:H+ antiporter-2